MATPSTTQGCQTISPLAAPPTPLLQLDERCVKLSRIPITPSSLSVLFPVPRKHGIVYAHPRSMRRQARPGEVIIYGPPPPGTFSRYAAPTHTSPTLDAQEVPEAADACVLLGCDHSHSLPPTPRLRVKALPEIDNDQFPTPTLQLYQPTPLQVTNADESVCRALEGKLAALELAGASHRIPHDGQEPSVESDADMLATIDAREALMAIEALTMRALIHPLLARPPRRDAHLSLHWDLADDPSLIVFQHAPNALCLTECAVCLFPRAREEAAFDPSSCDAEPSLVPLPSIVLMIPSLTLEISLAHQGGRAGDSQMDVDEAEDPGYLTVREVLDGLYDALRAAVSEEDIWPLSATKYNSVLWATRQREWAEAAPGTIAHWARAPTVRWIDFLGERREFRGIRPALRHEVPQGRSLGEVYIVEVGACGDAWDRA